MDNNILIIDQGSHSSRALVFDAAGRVLASASAPVSTRFPQNRFVEQSPDEILRSVFSALAQLQSRLVARQLHSIGSAGLIVQRSSLLACSKDTLKPITRVISWQDTRNQQQLDVLQAEHAGIRTLTGLRPNAHYGASKMRWLLDNDMAVQGEYAKNNLLFTPLAAWLASQLTGSVECRVDAVIASRTLLTALGEMQWHEKLLKLFGVDASCLPCIVPSLHDFGCVNVAGRNIPLQLVGGDQSFIAFASGFPVSANHAYVNVGSGAFVQMLKPESCDVINLLCNPLAISSDSSVIVLEGTVNAAATALDWLWQQQGMQLDYVALDKALQAELSPPIFLNTLAGTGSPCWLPARSPQFFGDGSLAAKAAGVIESIVFALVDNIRLLRQANPELATITIGGGLSHANGFCQKLANLGGLQVTRPLMHEISARGAALYRMQTLGTTLADRQDVFYPCDDKPLKKRYEEYLSFLTGSI